MVYLPTVNLLQNKIKHLKIKTLKLLNNSEVVQLYEHSY